MFPPDNGGDPLPGDFPDVPLPPFLADCCGDAAAPAGPVASPPAFQSLPWHIQAAGEVTPPAPPVVPSGERRPSATFVFPKRKLEDVPGTVLLSHSPLSGKI